MTAKKGLLFSHKSADDEALGREFLCLLELVCEEARSRSQRPGVP